MPDVGDLKSGNVFYLEEESMVTGGVTKKYYRFLAQEGNAIKAEPSSVVSEAFFTDLPPEILSLEEMTEFVLGDEDDHET